MRVIRLLLALTCLAIGILVGALNHQLVAVDLGFDVMQASLGVTLLVSVLIGALIGGLAVTAGVVLPMQQQLRRLRRGDRVAAATARDGT